MDVDDLRRASLAEGGPGMEYITNQLTWAADEIDKLRGDFKSEGRRRKFQ